MPNDLMCLVAKLFISVFNQVTLAVTVPMSWTMHVCLLKMLQLQGRKLVKRLFWLFLIVHSCAFGGRAEQTD